MRIYAICAALAVLVFSATFTPNAAQTNEVETGPVTNLPLPRYVSLRSSEINVRRGPGLDYRKDWVFRRSGLPVRVVDEYGDWRRVVDKDDAGGWVYHAMITGRRTVLITGDGVLFREDPASTSAATAQAERGVVARLRACEVRWCEIEAEGHRGWVRKGDIWGVEEAEVFTR